MGNIRFDWRWVALIVFVALLVNAGRLPWPVVAVTLGGGGHGVEAVVVAFTYYSNATRIISSARMSLAEVRRSWWSLHSRRAAGASAARATSQARRCSGDLADLRKSKTRMISVNRIQRCRVQVNFTESRLKTYRRAQDDGFSGI
jgi:hypothetical protein